jgi:hypothetical protein
LKHDVENCRARLFASRALEGGIMKVSESGADAQERHCH